RALGEPTSSSGALEVRPEGDAGVHRRPPYPCVGPGPRNGSVRDGEGGHEPPRSLALSVVEQVSITVSAEAESISVVRHFVTSAGFFFDAATDMDVVALLTS